MPAECAIVFILFDETIIYNVETQNMIEPGVGQNTETEKNTS